MHRKIVIVKIESSIIEISESVHWSRRRYAISFISVWNDIYVCVCVCVRVRACVCVYVRTCVRACTCTYLPTTTFDIQTIWNQVLTELYTL